MTLEKLYTKKPVTISAAQWFKDYDHEGVDVYRYPPVSPLTGEISASDDAVFMGEMKHNEIHPKHRRESCDALMLDHGWIDTLEGGHVVCPGDWIIRGVVGELYPCKPDVFAMTYEETHRTTWAK